MEKSREEIREKLRALMKKVSDEDAFVVAKAFGLGLDMAYMIRKEAEQEATNGKEQN